MQRKINLTGPAFSWTAGFAALGFAASIVLANVVLVPAGLPRTGAAVAEVGAFFTTAGAAVGVSSVFGPLAWVLAVLFGAGVVAAVRRSERERGEAWSLVGFAGLVLQNATFSGVTAIRLALASGSATPGGADPDVTGALWALHDALFTLNGTFLALALVGLSMSGLRSRLIRPWHGGLGLVAAVLQFGSAAATPLVIAATGPLGLLSLAGWLLWVVWIVGYGVVLVRVARGCTPAAVGGTDRAQLGL
jgi:hypothetical protein